MGAFYVNMEGAKVGRTVCVFKILVLLSTSSISIRIAILPIQQALLKTSSINASRRIAQFALLKPGFAWYDAPSRTLLSLVAVQPCPGPGALPVYNYSVSGLYGFRGEWPGSEAYAMADYDGFAGGLRCATLALTAGAARPPDEPLAIAWSLELATRTLRLTSPAELESVTWKDDLNRTVGVALAPGSAGAAAVLPAATLQAGALAIKAQVLARDGRHLALSILAPGLASGGTTPGTVRVQASTKHYLLSGLRYESESRWIRGETTGDTGSATVPTPSAAPPSAARRVSHSYLILESAGAGFLASLIVAMLLS